MYVFGVFFLSLSIIFLKFIHVGAYFSVSSLFIAELYSIVWAYHILFISSPVVGYLGGFRFLAIFSNTVVSIHLKVFCGHMFSLLLGLHLGMILPGPFYIW